jgi:beta-N-acetylhexosaminidase
MLDIAGTTLLPEERERLRHPLVGGVILFSRNYESPEQVTALIGEVHALREPRLIVAVDHEGGRVQRFRAGFTAIPPMRRLGEHYDENPKRARRLAEAAGWLMATELRGVGADISFAPVLDLDLGVSKVIGDRAFHNSPDVVADLAHSFMVGMREAGMAATGKHFPGHGSVAPDSHLALPVDDRALADIRLLDMLPFARMIHFGLPAVMTAHIIFSRVDRLPVSFSRRWISDILRRELAFPGVVFSDDLSMKGAAGIGAMEDRVRAALDAGCDMALVCNDPGGADRVLDRLGRHDDPVSAMRLVRMHGRHPVNRVELAGNPHYQDALRLVSHIA